MIKFATCLLHPENNVTVRSVMLLLCRYIYHLYV